MRGAGAPDLPPARLVDTLLLARAGRHSLGQKMEERCGKASFSLQVRFASSLKVEAGWG